MWFKHIDDRRTCARVSISPFRVFVAFVNFFEFPFSNTGLFHLWIVTSIYGFTEATASSKMRSFSRSQCKVIKNSQIICSYRRWMFLIRMFNSHISNLFKLLGPNIHTVCYLPMVSDVTNNFIHFNLVPSSISIYLEPLPLHGPALDLVERSQVLVIVIYLSKRSPCYDSTNISNYPLLRALDITPLMLAFFCRKTVLHRLFREQPTLRVIQFFKSAQLNFSCQNYYLHSIYLIVILRILFSSM